MRNSPLLTAILILLSWSVPGWTQYLSNGIPSAVVGGYATIFVHESGHAITAKLLGREVEQFRPYPTKAKWRLEDGSIADRWTLGFVKVKVLEDGRVWNNDREHAWFSSMGSGANVLAVLCLAPLLPEISGFGAQALDDMLVFSTFDMPGYILTDALGFSKGTGDWNQVAAATHTSIWWWLAGSISESLLLNQYRLHFRNRAPDHGTLRGAITPIAAFRFKF